VLDGGDAGARIVLTSSRFLSRWSLLFGLVAVVGVVLRVWVYRSVSGTPNADEAVVGLMARHALHGELTTFYWGQAYAGSQEALLTLPFFLVAGSGWLALRLVPILLTVVASLLVWRVGKRTIGDTPAAVAAAVFWIWPAFNVFQLTHQQGLYASDIVYCSLLLLLALRIVERPDRARVGLFGLVLGLALWQTAQIVPVAVPMIIWTAVKRPASLRHVWFALPLTVLGMLPWLIWNAGHGWESLAMPDYGDKVQSLRLLASPFLPMMVGLRAPFSADLLLPGTALTYLAYLGLVALFVVGAIRARHRDSSLLYVVAVVFPFVYALSPKTSLALGTPRYLVVLTPVIVLLVAQLATRYYRAVALLALVTVVSIVTLHRMNVWFGDTPRPVTQAVGLGPRHTVQWVPRDLSPLVAALDTLGIDHIYTDYWLAYRLDFDTGERIVAVENRLLGLTVEDGKAVPTNPTEVRYPPYEKEVRAAPHGFVFYRPIVDSATITAQLRRLGYRRHDVGSFVIFAPRAAAQTPSG
jgi:hypothetical protein